MAEAECAAGGLAPVSKNATKRAAKHAAKQEAKRRKRGAAQWEMPATDLLPSVNKRATGCRRFKAVLWYEGAGFHGWAPQHPPGQPRLRTVGDVVEEAFRTVIGQKVRVHPAGRTDAGVSASGMVCQFDAETDADPEQLLPRLNVQLPSDCRVLTLQKVDAAFEAMGCLWKRYAYTIPASSGDELHSFCCQVLQSSGPPSDGAHRTVQLLDFDKMQAAAQVLIGKHDFAAFQSKGGRKTTVRTLHSCTVTKVGEGSEMKLRLAVEGDGFLYNMVRILSGTLLEVGCGLRTLEEVAKLVAPGGGVTVAPGGVTVQTRAVRTEWTTTATRAMAGPTLPAVHLCLEYIEYDRPWTSGQPDPP